MSVEIKDQGSGSLRMRGEDNGRFDSGAFKE